MENYEVKPASYFLIKNGLFYYHTERHGEQ